MFWRKKTGSDGAVDACAQSLLQALIEGVKVDGRVRAEDLIAAAASIASESCIDAAGSFNPRKHEFVPGSRVFSDRVNEIFTGDVPDATLDQLPASSVVGILRDRLIAGGYAKSDFPSLRMIFEHFAANIGNESDWGKVPLAVPDENQPFLLPLRVAYETRPIVDRAFRPLHSAEERMRAAVIALADALIAVRQVIDSKTAVLLALQMVNGMAKTAPMTDDAMKSLG
jgi:hypothetical protein